MNLYLTLPGAKRALQIAAERTDLDALIFELIESASRDIDAFCLRHFFTASQERRFEPWQATIAKIDELISAETVSLIDPEDSDVEAVEYPEAQYQLYPLNEYPKLKIKLYSTASELWVEGTDCLEIQGVFGYGDGSADPWEAAEITVTVADATTATITLSAGDVIEVGHTIKVESEQMFVRAVTTTVIEADPEADPPVVASTTYTATVKRGVNGTAGAAHASAAASLALYPAKIVSACRALVCTQLNDSLMGGQESESVDGHAVKTMNEDQRLMMMNRICSGYARG